MIGGYGQLSYGFNYYGPTGEPARFKRCNSQTEGGRLA